MMRVQLSPCARLQPRPRSQRAPDLRHASRRSLFCGGSTTRFRRDSKFGRASLEEAAEQAKTAADRLANAVSQAAAPKEAVAELKRIAAKVDALEARVSSMEGVLKDVAATSRTQTLQWAMANASLREFEYRNVFLEKTYKSGPVVEGILDAFQRGCGLWIEDDRCVGPDGLTRETITDEHRQAFHIALSNQIHALTGVKPRIVLTKNDSKKDQYAIFRV